MQSEEGDIYNDLSRLFQECDDVSSTFYQTSLTDPRVKKVEKEKDPTTSLSDPGVKDAKNGRLTHVDKAVTSTAGKDIHVSNANKKVAGSQNEKVTVSNRSDEDSTTTESLGLSSERSSGQNFSVSTGSSDTSKRSVKRSWKIPHGAGKKNATAPSLHESSREELASSSVENEDSSESTVNEITMVKNKEEYPSSFIHSSGEDGECTVTSSEEELDATVVEVKPKKERPHQMINFAPLRSKSDVNSEDLKEKIHKGIGTRKLFMTHIFNNRKRTLEEKNENTPKRHKLFDTEALLSPISCGSDENLRSSDYADTPLIESKFNFGNSDTCSSTPLAREPDDIGAFREEISAKSGKNKCGKKLDLDDESKADAEFEFACFSDKADLGQEREKTLDELIADITALIEGDAEGDIDDLDSQMKADKDDEPSLSKINMEEFLSELKTKSLCESQSVTKVSDKVVNDVESRSLGQDVTVLENIADNETLKEADETLTVESAKRSCNVVGITTQKGSLGSASRVLYSVNRDQKKSGRFQAEVTLDRIEDGSQTNRESVGKDICETEDVELFIDGDLLNLDDYEDEEGYIDEKELEKSHLRKDLNLTAQGKLKSDLLKTETDGVVSGKPEDTENNNNKGISSKTEILVEKNDKQTNEEMKIQQKKETVVRLIKFTHYDENKYRKNLESEFEYEVCQKWGTTRPPNPDVNLTTSTTYRNKCNIRDLKTSVGYLEGEHVVCTHLYEEEILSKFKNYGLTDGQSKLCCMSIEAVLDKLQHQRDMIEDMHKTNLMRLEKETEWKLEDIHQRARQEEINLRERQQLEFNDFRFGSVWMYNPIQMAMSLTRLRQEHNMQMNRMKSYQRQRFMNFSKQRREMLDAAVRELNQQIQPIDELIAQLQNSENLVSHSPQKYGPPIMVSLRKGPCKASKWKHTTVNVCLSAAIAQAVSLEDDLYDHYYSY